MRTAVRMTIQQMIKAASEGASDHAQLSLEAARQLTNQGEPSPSVKTASRSDFPESVPTAYVDKLAAAAEYVIGHMKIADIAESDTGVGKGPNSLGVLEATSENNEVEAGEMGQATPSGVPPMNPPTQTAPNTSSDPGTGLEDNTSMSHPAQPADPMGNDRSVKESSAPLSEIRKHAGVKEKAIGAAKTVAHGAKRVGQVVKNDPVLSHSLALGVGAHAGVRAGRREERRLHENSSKLASAEEIGGVDPRLVEYLMGQVKQAEDAINPAHISGGTIPVGEPPEGVRASGESGPGEPSDVTSQKRLISSNEAAMNYTKREAKADPKSDAARVLTQPVLSAAHDNVLQKAFENTERAGVKISHSLRRDAARAILEKMAEEAEEKSKSKGKKKEKESMGGMGTYQAPPVGGAAGAGM